MTTQRKSQWDKLLERGVKAYEYGNGNPKGKIFCLEYLPVSEPKDLNQLRGLKIFTSDRNRLKLPKARFKVNKTYFSLF